MTLFRNIDGRKRRSRGKNIHKAMKTFVNIFKIIKMFFVTVQPKNVRDFVFTDHLQLLFIDQPQSDILSFMIFDFHIYSILVTKWKHEIGPNNTITLSE